jgi:hypothetical protein
VSLYEAAVMLDPEFAYFVIRAGVGVAFQLTSAVSIADCHVELYEYGLTSI